MIRGRSVRGENPSVGAARRGGARGGSVDYPPRRPGGSPRSRRTVGAGANRERDCGAARPSQETAVERAGLEGAAGRRPSVTGFVVDCSIAVSWLLEDEATPRTDALLDRLRNDSAHAPSVWRLELGNALAQAERRKRISSARVAAYLDIVDRLPDHNGYGNGKPRVPGDTGACAKARSDDLRRRVSGARNAARGGVGHARQGAHPRRAPRLRLRLALANPSGGAPPLPQPGEHAKRALGRSHVRHADGNSASPDRSRSCDLPSWTPPPS